MLKDDCVEWFYDERHRLHAEAVTDYQTGTYHYRNELIRRAGEAYIPTKATQWLDGAFDHAQEFSGLTLWRGLSGRFFDEDRGDIQMLVSYYLHRRPRVQSWTEYGYLSTTTDIDVARRFATTSGGNQRGIVLKLSVPEPIPMLQPTLMTREYVNEYEVLLPRGCRINVTKQRRGIVHADVLPPASASTEQTTITGDLITI